MVVGFTILAGGVLTVGLLSPDTVSYGRCLPVDMAIALCEVCRWSTSRNTNSARLSSSEAIHLRQGLGNLKRLPVFWGSYRARRSLKESLDDRALNLHHKHVGGHGQISLKW